MLARLEVGRSSVIVKAMRAPRDYGKGKGKQPPWKKDVEIPQRASSSSKGSIETEKAEIRMQTLKKSLTAIAASQESSECDEYTYEDESDSEGEFLPAKEGTKIANTTSRQQEKKNQSVPGPQARSHTEEKRTIPVIRAMTKDKSPVKAKGTIQTIYFP
jgi:hypothetical protein